MSRLIGRVAVPTTLLLLTALAPTTAQATGDDPVVSTVEVPPGVRATPRQSSVVGVATDGTVVMRVERTVVGRDGGFYPDVEIVRPDGSTESHPDLDVSEVAGSHLITAVRENDAVTAVTSRVLPDLHQESVPVPNGYRYRRATPDGPLVYRGDSLMLLPWDASAPRTLADGDSGRYLPVLAADGHGVLTASYGETSLDKLVLIDLQTLTRTVVSIQEDCRSGSARSWSLHGLTAAWVMDDRVVCTADFAAPAPHVQSRPATGIHFGENKLNPSVLPLGDDVVIWRRESPYRGWRSDLDCPVYALRPDGSTTPLLGWGHDVVAAGDGSLVALGGATPGDQALRRLDGNHLGSVVAEVASYPATTSDLAVEGDELVTAGDSAVAEEISSRRLEVTTDPASPGSLRWGRAVSDGVSGLVTDGSSTAWSSSPFVSGWTWRGSDGTVITRKPDGVSPGPVSAVSGKWLLLGGRRVVDVTNPSAAVVSNPLGGLSMQDGTVYAPGRSAGATRSDLVVSDDLATGRLGRLQVPGCTVRDTSVAGSWLLVSCEEGQAVLLDLTTGSSRDLDRGAVLGNGFLLRIVGGDLSWSSVDGQLGQWHSLGTVAEEDPLSARSTGKRFYSASHGAVPSVAWLDPARRGVHLARLPVAPSSSPGRLAAAVRPGAPTHLTATPEDNGAYLSWEPPAKTADFPVVAYSVRGQRVPASDRGLRVLNLTNGQATTLSVVTIDSRGQQSPATTVTVTPRSLPTSVERLTATAGDGSADLQWTPAGGRLPVLDYIVTWNNGAGRLVVPASATSVHLPGLTNGTYYAFELVARNSDGVSPYAAYAGALPRGLPSAPRSVRISSGPKHVLVTWQPPVSDGGAELLGYVVTLSDGQSRRTDRSHTSAWFDLKNGQSASATVTALSAVGRSPLVATGRALAADTPFTMDPPRASSGRRAVVVSWSRARANGTPVTGYHVRCSNGTVRTLGPSTTRMTFTGLRSRTKASFRIRPLSKLGPAPYSQSSRTVRVR